MSLTFSRVSQQVARYTPLGLNAECCGRCRFYMAPSSCGRIVGPVSPRGWCKYYSREMVQQWGGSVPVATAGGPPGVTFDQSFLTGSLGTGAVFTRASTGWAYGPTGVLTSFAANVPRFDYDPVTLQPRGVLLEDTSTNVCLQSGNLASGAWNVQGSPTAPTVTGNNTAAPDGTITGTRLVYPAVSSAYSYIGQGFTLTAVPYAVSVWLRGSVGGEQLYVGMTTGTVQYSTARLTLTTNWQRFSVITPALTAGGWTFQIGTDFRGGSQTSTPAQTVYAWGGMLEASPYVSSYISTTTAAVTRAAEALSYPIASVTGFNAAAGSLLFEYDGANTPSVIGGLSDGSTANMIYYSDNGAANCYVATVAKTIGLTPVRAYPAVSKIVTSYEPNRFSGALKGGAVASDGTIPAGPFAWTTRLSVGCSPWGLDSQIGTHMRRAAYWGRALSDPEKQQVTT